VELQNNDKRCEKLGLEGYILAKGWAMGAVWRLVCFQAR